MSSVAAAMRDASPSPTLGLKGNGAVVDGSARELVGWDSRITAGGIGFLLDVARRALPPLMQATVKRVWHGFRPMRQDGGRW